MNINEKKAAAFLHMPTPPPYFLPQLTPATPPPRPVFLSSLPLRVPPLLFFAIKNPPPVFFTSSTPPVFLSSLPLRVPPPPLTFFCHQEHNTPPPVILSSLPLRVPPPPYIFAIKNPPYFFLEVSPPSSLGGGGGHKLNGIAQWTCQSKKKDRVYLCKQTCIAHVMHVNLFILSSGWISILFSVDG